MNRKILSSELLKLAKDIVAIEFDSEEALKEYLHGHPKADKSKHTVKQTSGGGAKKEDVSKGQGGSGDDGGQSGSGLSTEDYKKNEKAFHDAAEKIDTGGLAKAMTDGASGTKDWGARYVGPNETLESAEFSQSGNTVTVTVPKENEWKNGTLKVEFGKTSTEKNEAEGFATTFLDAKVTGSGSFFEAVRDNVERQIHEFEVLEYGDDTGWTSGDRQSVKSPEEILEISKKKITELFTTALSQALDGAVRKETGTSASIGNKKVAAELLKVAKDLVAADECSRLQDVRKDLTKASSSLERLKRSKDSKVAKAAKEAEQLVDKARRIIFDAC